MALIHLDLLHRRARSMYESVAKLFSSESKVPSEKESANALKLACNLNG
jgi:hypothetical protein